MKFVILVLIAALSMQFSGSQALAKCSARAKLPDPGFDYDPNVWNAMILPTIGAALATSKSVAKKTHSGTAQVGATFGVMLSPVIVGEVLKRKHKGQHKSAQFAQF